jgi:hypothetical protein
MFRSCLQSLVLRRAVLFLLLIALFRPGFLAAQTGDGEGILSAQPRDRITGYMDDERTIVLRGNRHPLATAANDAGVVSDYYPMERMILALKPDAAQQAALEQLVTAQHDPASPYYHRWLTPEEYGERFGVSENDLAQIVEWLGSHGLESLDSGPGRNSIVFSGTAAQVEEAFHTQIHAYQVNGELHHANASDPEIPDALSEVVAGIVSLHDFRSEPMHTALQ